MSGPNYRKPQERPPSVAPPRPPPPRPTTLVPAEIPVSRTANSSRASARPGTSATVRYSPSSHATPYAVAPASHPDEPAQPSTKSKCESCELLHKRTWNCSYCDMNFCDPCWNIQGPHKPGRKGPDGLPHEKADPNIVQRLKEILTPPTDQAEQQSLHVDDDDTTWFGVGRDNNGHSIFEDYGRYATMMADSNTGEHKSRYPQLVSFIGQTGAGKSTLIKMLIDQQERRERYQRKNTFPSPVVGSIRNENVPTSGDVHLYADPKWYFGEYPMLYADCEGLEGGEIMPISAQLRSAPIIYKGKDHNIFDHRVRNKLKVGRGSQRNLDWADSPEKSKRQYAVTELYPRLLYTFSDVIVFVLRNSKTFESSVLSKLIEWASAAMEKSLNQPTLPHAVIALNATDMGVDENEWDPKHATDALMSTVADAINRDPSYQSHADFWRNRGKRVRTMKDLLECYYSSITVVRIPVKGRYMKIDEQVQKLHKTLFQRCNESFRAKRKSRMLSNSEELNVYLQCAFDHFSHDLDTPFNFMDAGFKISAIPLDLGGNILKLAVAIRDCRRFTDPRNIFNELSWFVASCISLDIVRQGSLKGPAEQILQNFYMDYCDSALDDFCAVFWPCTFSNKKGKCVNVAERHTKGHQNSKGQIIGTGPYESTFTFESYADTWLDMLHQHILHFEAKVQEQLLINQATDELNVTTALHLTGVKRFYQHLGGADKFISHSVCFCCLREMAEHPLPCGHILCTRCVRVYGSPSERLSGMYVVTSCPLHDTTGVFPAQWGIYFKPELAGVRILSLDGGGIRGIAILETLRQVELELGKRIPVQDFFDLIVGTSTGGIIALGIGLKNWSIEYSIALFMKLVDQAFTRRLGGIRFGTRKYKTEPLEQCLKENFKDELMFGGTEEYSISYGSYGRKVAVTASCETAEQAVIFTNYNRPDDEQINYRMERPDDPRHEMKLWEAARATSAAPTFFRPFVNSRTKEGYIDGAIFHNNPVRIANYESKLIWPDVEELHPDILLSIGTAHNGKHTDGNPGLSALDQRRVQHRKKLTKERPKERKPSGLNPLAEVQSWLYLMFKRMDDILDAESIWRDFRKDIITNSSGIESQRYQRLNPKVKSRTPKMDDKRELNKLDAEVKEALAKYSMKNKIRAIAYRLITSSFYFEKSGPPRETDDHFVVQGTILCRFATGSNNLRNMGHLLQERQLKSFQPYFSIHETTFEGSAQQIEISPDFIHRMTAFGSFDVGSIAIPVSSQTGSISIDLYLTSERTLVFPISGFPRNLADSAPLKKEKPTSPNPERSAMATSRHSVRRKRTMRPHLYDKRPASDVSSDSYEFPETPSDVSDWTRRRNEARRPPPKALIPLDSPPVYELDGATSFVASPLDDEDEELLQAIERREAENMRSLVRSATGTDEEELERAIQLSLVEQ
ncbi:hypothetical protein K491DRAFT_697115 [Lophiostoma macrostomum CBS 122681]|uniref:FabD/lysophospholipase-like protein n=1 Tax=Lophiostoma macrostomum CBS 122681 TaxID=1314788 RepID=A0A6A6SSY3_9PLEO|nr:hypothetical protein K491DRAFT_697115 [Lophiostoma macrostomum CBS 122681]